MPGGIEDIASLLPRAPAPTQLKDLGQIQQDMAETQRINATRDALRQSTSDAQQLQQQRLKTQAGLAQAMKEAKTLDELPMLVGKNTGNPQLAQQIAEGLAQTKAHLATAQTADLAAQVQKDKIITGRLDGIIDPKNPDKTWFDYQKAAPELAQMGVPQFKSPDELISWNRQHHLGGELAAQEFKNREIAVSEQNAAANTAKSNKEAADAARAQGYQDLSAVSGQVSYDQWRESHPDLAKSLPPMYEPARIKSELKKAVPIAKQLELESSGANTTADNKRADEQLQISKDRLAFDKTKFNHELTKSQEEDVPLSPEALQMAAKAYAITYTLPPMGNGKNAAADKRAIMNMAATQYGGADLASNKARYMGLKTSLSDMEKMTNRVEAFENTAGKNIDIFLNSAKDVIDSGIPLLNKPLREAASALGSSNVAAFRAAREAALTEVAKVLEGSTGSSGVTVSGREAVKTLSDESASVAQQVKAMKVLKAEMANRKESNRQQIKAINDEISGLLGPAGAPKQDTAAPKGKITVTAPDGSKHDFDTQSQADAFKKLANIK